MPLGSIFVGFPKKEFTVLYFNVNFHSIMQGSGVIDNLLLNVSNTDKEVLGTDI